MKTIIKIFNILFIILLIGCGNLNKNKIFDVSLKDVNISKVTLYKLEKGKKRLIFSQDRNALSINKSRIRDGSFYILEAIGENGKVNLKAIAKGEWLKNKPVSLSFLSQISYVINSKYIRNTSYLENALNSFAKDILKEDINEDGVINSRDILFFDKDKDFEKLNFKLYSREILKDIENKIKKGDKSYYLSLQKRGLFSEFFYKRVEDSNYTKIFVKKDRLYALNKERLEVFDLSYDTPTLLVPFDIGNFVKDFKFSPDGDKVFFIRYYNILSLLDFSVPYSPKYLNIVDMGGILGYDIDFKHNIMYANNNKFEGPYMEKLDISNLSDWKSLPEKIPIREFVINFSVVDEGSKFLYLYPGMHYRIIVEDMKNAHAILVLDGLDLLHRTYSFYPVKISNDSKNAIIYGENRFYFIHFPNNYYFKYDLYEIKNALLDENVKNIYLFTKEDKDNFIHYFKINDNFITFYNGSSYFPKDIDLDNIAVHKNYIYSACKERGIRRVNLKNLKKDPFYLISKYNILNFSKKQEAIVDIKADENKKLAYLLCDSSLKILDIKNPFDIKLIKDYNDFSHLIKINISKNRKRAYILDNEKLSVFDIENPLNISKIYDIKKENIIDFEINKKNIYIITKDSLFIEDKNFNEIAKIKFDHQNIQYRTLSSLALFENKLFIGYKKWTSGSNHSAIYGGGIITLDISNSSNPKIIKLQKSKGEPVKFLFSYKKGKIYTIEIVTDISQYAGINKDFYIISYNLNNLEQNHILKKARRIESMDITLYDEDDKIFYSIYKKEFGFLDLNSNRENVLKKSSQYKKLYKSFDKNSIYLIEGNTNFEIADLYFWIN